MVYETNMRCVCMYKLYNGVTRLTTLMYCTCKISSCNAESITWSSTDPIMIVYTNMHTWITNDTESQTNNTESQTNDTESQTNDTESQCQCHCLLPHRYTHTYVQYTMLKYSICLWCQVLKALNKSIYLLLVLDCVDDTSLVPFTWADNTCSRFGEGVM